MAKADTDARDDLGFASTAKRPSSADLLRNQNCTEFDEEIHDVLAYRRMLRKLAAMKKTTPDGEPDLTFSATAMLVALHNLVAKTIPSNFKVTSRYHLYCLNDVAGDLPSNLTLMTREAGDVVPGLAIGSHKISPYCRSTRVSSIGGGASPSTLHRDGMWKKPRAAHHQP